MSLSQWDLKHLTPKQQAEGLALKQQWGGDPNQRTSLHTAFEEMRAGHGYSGGIDGSQYIPIDVYNPPTAPEIGQWESPNQGMINDMFEQMKNPPKYESEYADLINQSISGIVNRPNFSYDSENDEAYQAFRQRALRAGDKAYADNLGGMSAMTGGRPNSWAGTVASQARNQFVLQAEEAVIHFEDRAYSRYKDETADMYNLVNLLNSQDEVAYSRFRDSIGDTKDLMGLVLQLDEREFNQYKFQAENEWKVFDSEVRAYEGALQFKKDKISEAIDRINLQGFVNNQDAITLGVPSGTLSQGARERAEQMEDYIKKSEIDLENEKKIMKERHSYDIKLLNAREAAASSSRGGGSGGGVNYDEDGNPQATPADAKKRNSIYTDFEKLVTSDNFNRATNEQKAKMINDEIDKIIRDFNDGILGDNGAWVANEALGMIRKSTAYINYIANPEDLKSRSNISAKQYDAMAESKRKDIRDKTKDIKPDIKTKTIIEKEEYKVRPGK